MAKTILFAADSNSKTETLLQRVTIKTFLCDKDGNVTKNDKDEPNPGPVLSAYIRTGFRKTERGAEVTMYQVCLKNPETGAMEPFQGFDKHGEPVKGNKVYKTMTEAKAALIPAGAAPETVQADIEWGA